MYQALLPYADLFVCGGAGLTMLDGSVQRYLGLSALALGRLGRRGPAPAGGGRGQRTEGLACAARRPRRALAPRSGAGRRALGRPAAGGVLATAEAAALAASAAAVASRLGMAPLLRSARSLSASLDGAAAGPLTRREGEIAALIARGLTNRQIAAALHISERTAENHVQHILTKLGLHTRTQIALWSDWAAGPAGAWVRRDRWGHLSGAVSFVGPRCHARAMPRVSSPDGLAELLDRQLSVASRGQLLALGLKDDAMQYRMRPGGPWQALLPGVYLAASGVPSFPQKEMAALLYAGPGSLVTGPVALMHYSIRSDPDRGRHRRPRARRAGSG